MPLTKVMVSIIIPVYNASRYLSDCMNSILDQNYKELEIILINDGSRDNSLDLCKYYAELDERVSYIDQTNGGPGAARNAGLEQATGKYLLFFDSDDLVLPNTIEKMVKAMDGHDLAIALFSLNTSSGQSVRGLIKQEMYFDKDDFLEKLSIWPGAYYYSALWNKIYKRDIVEKHRIRFRTDFIWGEDCLFNMNYYLYINQIHIVDFVVYQYNRKVSGLSWGSVFQLHKGLRIKREIYRALKKVFIQADQYQKYFWQVQKYILNITLMD
ncbi:MAG: glycosyltransferase family 2 protein [Clostridiales bacterium]|nr:glycosyltransferase family 2 protein [Clostridiales bacterium]